MRSRANCSDLRSDLRSDQIKHDLITSDLRSIEAQLTAVTPQLAMRTLLQSIAAPCLTLL